MMTSVMYPSVACASLPEYGRGSALRICETEITSPTNAENTSASAKKLEILRYTEFCGSITESTAIRPAIMIARAEYCMLL